jgi:hypothetical protein
VESEFENSSALVSVTQIMMEMRDLSWSHLVPAALASQSGSLFHCGGHRYENL